MIDAVKLMSVHPSGRASIRGGFDGRSFAFTRTEKPDALIELIGKGHRRRLSDEGERAIREGRFKMKITLPRERGA